MVAELVYDDCRIELEAEVSLLKSTNGYATYREHQHQNNSPHEDTDRLLYIYLPYTFLHLMV